MGKTLIAMAELSDEEVFGKSEMSDAEVFSAPAPLEPARSAGQQTSINTGTLGGNIQVQGASNLPYKQAGKVMLPLAASMVAPAIAAELAPAVFSTSGATSLTGYIGKLLASGAVSGLGGGVTRQGLNLAEGSTTPGKAARDVAFETAMGAGLNLVLGGVANQVVSGVRGAIASPGARMGGFKVGLAQRPWANPAEAQIQAARDVVKSITGKSIPETPGEILGETAGGTSYLAVEKSIRGAGDLTPAARDAANRAVLYAAVEHAGGTGMTAEDLAKAAMQDLRRQTGPVGEAAKKAINDFAAELHGSVTRAVKAQQSEVGNLFDTATPETPFSGGGKLKDMASEVLDSTKGQFDAAFAPVRNSPLFKQPLIEPSNSAQWADDLEPLALKKSIKTGEIQYDRYGNPSEVGGAEGVAKPIPSTLPEGTQKFFNEVRQFASTPQSLESMRVFRNKIGRSIKNNDILPGIGAYEKIGLLKAISRDIDASLAPLSDPILSDLKAANKLYTENVDRFKGAFESGIIRDIGAEKGATGESIYSALTGASGQSKLSQLKNLLGDQYGSGIEVLRNTVKPELLKASTDANGLVNVGRLFAQAKNLPPELFPELKALQKIAQAESRLAGVSVPKDPEEAFAWYKKDPQAFDEFLAHGGEVKFKDAYKLDLANQEAFKNAANAAVKKFDAMVVKDNPEGFVDLVVNKGIPTDDVAQAMTAWRKSSPEVARNMETAFMENLLRASKFKGISDVSEMAKMLKSPTIGTEAPLGGKFAKTAEAILGPGKTEQLRQVTEAMTKVALKNPSDKSIMQTMASDESADALYLVARKAGMGAPVSIIRRFYNNFQYPTWKYRLVARWITEDNPQLRDLITKPIRDLTPEEAASFADLVSGFVVGDPSSQQQR
jgi:hypothetical protein